MDAKTPPLDLYLELMHSILQSPVLYYFTSAVFLIILSSQVGSWINQKRGLVIPTYGLDENDKDAPKKRWMRDSINLLGEGCRKVIIPISAVLHIPTRLQTSSLVIHHNEKPIDMLNLQNSSFETNRFKYGLQKEIKLFFPPSS
jgi:hypothetical protein